MKRTKKPVVTEEITVLEITSDEFADIAAQECVNTLKESPDDFPFAVMMSLAFAEFSARLMARLFDEEAEG